MLDPQRNHKVNGVCGGGAYGTHTFSLSESDFNNLLTHLATWGLKEHSDLQFLSIEDIEGVIPPVAVRRLMYYLKTTGQLIDTEDTLPSC
ncbi:hypothetical protein PFLUV_G00268660 [Perca fluviatilis]|uniref:Uncharacterized protein n=1 Tax=Perca fluviatilis TaxID=8168 RepID=A0A6A5EFM9_PERFL|nr:hypothetical protein PFLUV_G00268660 [Perca fluviatilis]